MTFSRFIYFDVFVSFCLVETGPKLTKETAFVLGMFFCSQVSIYFTLLTPLCYFVYSPYYDKKGKTAVSRTLDVYNLQELSDEPDPHATLPFISHHTLNLSRDLNEANNKTNNNSESHYLNSKL